MTILGQAVESAFSEILTPVFQTGGPSQEHIAEVHEVINALRESEDLHAVVVAAVLEIGLAALEGQPGRVEANATQLAESLIGAIFMAGWRACGATASTEYLRKLYAREAPEGVAE